MVHLANNPADEAAANYSNELDKLRAEVSYKLSQSQPAFIELAIYNTKKIFSRRSSDTSGKFDGWKMNMMT